MIRDADNHALSVPVNLPGLPFSHPTSSRGGWSLSRTPKISEETGYILSMTFWLDLDDNADIGVDISADV